MPTLSLRTKLFVGLTIATGAALLFGGLISDHRLLSPEHFLECVVLSLLASTFKIKLPRMQSTIGANFVLFLIAISQFALGETLIIAALSCLVQCMWRPTTRPKTVQVFFSVASTVISVALAFELTSGLRAAGSVVPELVAASAIFFVANSGLMSVVLGLVRSESPLEIWRNCHRWAFPYYLAGSILAVAIALCIGVSGWAPALSMLPMLYMIYTCYGQWIRPEAEKAIA
ncbi:MAG TPA: hypothetical protein VKU01_30390 [Bryobacteraceae bacterium]|nr:hypothetical protein [Bryobacteraceae bacterium]